LGGGLCRRGWRSIWTAVAERVAQTPLWLFMGDDFRGTSYELRTLGRARREEGLAGGDFASRPDDHGGVIGLADPALGSGVDCPLDYFRVIPRAENDCPRLGRVREKFTHSLERVLPRHGRVQQHDVCLRAAGLIDEGVGGREATNALHVLFRVDNHAQYGPDVAVVVHA